MALNFSVNRDVFLKGLRLAQNIADEKSMMPILSHIMLHTVGEEGLLIVATDLCVSVSAELQSENKDEGALTLNAKALYKIVNNLPAEKVRFEEKEHFKVVVRSGRSNFRLSGLPARNYPKLPDHREQLWFEVDAETLKRMVNKTLYSVCKDETRYNLNGSLFECDGIKAIMVSTDGHRMSKVEGPLKGPCLDEGIIIPKKGLVELKRLLDDADTTCEMAIEKPYVYVRVGAVTFTVKIIDSSFPSYAQVVELDNDKHITVERNELLQALRRAQLVADEVTGVRLTFTPGELMLWSGDGKDDSYETLDVKYDGEKIVVALNPEYICDLLSRMEEDKIVIELGTPLTPVLFREQSGTHYLGVIMPMRI